jgi:DNA-binding transcriptional MerR regulator
MNNIKSKFSIKDLENLSGIKAHTIRIWEKRYGLFNPNRTETNIRYYSLESLQKILNIAFLNNNGFKISKIAKLSPFEISNKVVELSKEADTSNHYIDLLKLAMLNFDQGLFIKTYNELQNKFDFRSIFYDIFVPFLDEIGLLWQTNTINPAHEHFIVELIKQKILISTEKVLNKNFVSNNKEAFVLFLPDNEVHELGLMYTNYDILSHGHHTIYLGQSVPLESLTLLLSVYNKITFVSCFTIQPEQEHLAKYLFDFNKKLLKNTNNKFLVSGRITALMDNNDYEQIKSFKSTKEVLEHIEL